VELREILEKVRGLRKKEKNKKLLNQKRVTPTRAGDRNDQIPY
jgi:hypothetical protein